jgi:predicted dehydrogenase
MTRTASAKPSVRVALIGFGYWGPNYARVLHELPQVDLKVICDRSAERLAQARERYPGVATSADVDEALGRDDLDAAVIATPATTHEPLVEAALRHGLHVLVEKPMSLDAGGCDTLCRLASTAGRVLMVGYTFLYNAAIRKMKECMASDQFGQVYYLHATRTNLGPIRQDVNAAWDLAPHDVAIFNYLLEQEPEWASAVGTCALRTSRDDIVFATLGYRNSVVANIHVSWADPNKVREVVAVGSRRRVVFNDLNDIEPVRVFERGVAAHEAVADSYGEFKLLVRDGDIFSPRVQPSEPLKNQCLEFVDAIGAKRTPLTDGRFSCGVTRAMAAIDASIRRKGAAVEV